MADATNPDGTLLQSVAAALKALTVGETSERLFSNVIVGVEDVTPDSVRTMPSCVLTLGDSTWDRENPELGTLSIYADLFTKENSTARGANVVATKRQLSSIADTIRLQAGHFAGGDFMAAVSLARVGQARRVSREGIAVWTMRLVFEVLRG